ncbi:hypothetical protein F5B20DRAFT_225544 [Whalleya microplaca]|nr:hypothetical protein F5B20DRAFT_225544 [Whalleya microplaca]
MARRSARIASSSFKSITASPAPAPKLTSVTERDESPEEQHPKPSKKSKTPKRTQNATVSSPMRPPSTPAAATPVKLPMSEMHPSKVHPTMAEPSSGAKLGFVDIDYQRDHTDDLSGVTQATPSKSKTPLPSSAFTFRYVNPESDRTLGPEAQRMMDSLREEAVKIKSDLAAKRQQEKLEQGEAGDGRKIAQARGRAGRFSAAHMAEFKKMDSIENHPSAFRVTPGRLTPLKAGLKRSQSKANLDEGDSVRSKKSSSRLMPSSPEKQDEERESPVKRIRQRFEDDASTLRPVSRDGSAIPRPKTSGHDAIPTGLPRSQSHSNLTTPTKSSLARANSIKTPTVTLVKSPSKPDIATLTRTPSKKGFGTLKKSFTTNNLNASSDMPTHIQTPGRFDRVKSILRRQFSGSKPKTHLPQLATPSLKTPGLRGLSKELPPVPLTTPGRKLERHVDFTPETKRAALSQNSPSPIKSGLPRSKTLSKLPSSTSLRGKTITEETSTGEGEVLYPDLSAYCRDLNDGPEESNKEKAPESVPGTFTFRSDHTIKFDGTSPNGFGGAAGQASLRHVRNSVLPSPRMPGSFPRQSEIAAAAPNKENKDPNIGASGIPHGMSNKKRHRASWDEEEEEQDEGAARGAKKQRQGPAPAEGHALVAPRLLASQESPTKRRLLSPRTPASQRKKANGLSLSRLNMLARPKVRK